MKDSKFDVFATVTNKIIESLENGVAPWVKPWKSGGMNRPYNVVSGKAYKGINVILLSMNTYKSNGWATFKQWSDLGATIKKGEKGSLITFASMVENEKIVDGEIKKDVYFVQKYFTVFNVEQVEGWEPKEDTTPKDFNEVEEAEKTVAKLNANIIHGSDSACYIPSLDKVRMPMKTSFKDEASYYSTLFHEMGHWTGSEKRLNRDLSGNFGDESYAFEELIAELTSAFLCNIHGINGSLQHADYIGSWLKVLKNDKKAIFKASTLAQKATDYILNFE